MRLRDKLFQGLLYGLILIFTFTFIASNTFAQRANGTITGRVVAEDGQQISYAVVSITGSGAKRTTPRNLAIITDEDGNFVANGLDPIPYILSAWSPGYVLSTNSQALNPFEPNEARFTHVGESVTIKMIRGGVITGRVTNAADAPVIGVPVKATRILDEAGHPASNLSSGNLQNCTTDDRGIYRIYGLAPGSYIVAAGGSNTTSARPTPFAGRTMTYHPSSTRDDAALVKVSSGVEATGIDIHYRAESGFAISGKISGGSKVSLSAIQFSATILLRSSTTGDTIATTSFRSINHQSGYAFYGIPNGEYEVIAQIEGANEEGSMTSMPRRFTVRGADVTGIDLTLISNATISGAVIIEKAAGVQKCETRRESHLEEIIVKARRNEPNERFEFPFSIFPGYGIGVPYDKGTFTIRNLKPGRHRIEAQLPDETWYLKAMSITGATPTMDPRGGITVKPGDKLTGLNLTVTSGAAYFKGKVTPAEKLSSQMRVHLIPTEFDRKDDVLYFAETRTDSDGTFTFTNLAPGKYFVLARTIPDSESSGKPTWPAALESDGRTKLRKEAEMANVVIELKPCQRLIDYVLRLTK